MRLHPPELGPSTSFDELGSIDHDDDLCFAFGINLEPVSKTSITSHALHFAIV